MLRNHELFITLLIKVCLFAFPFIALELVFTRFTSFGVATGGAAFLAALTGTLLDQLLLKVEPVKQITDPVDLQTRPSQEPEAPSADALPTSMVELDLAPPFPAVDIHSSPLVEAYRVDLAQLRSEQDRAKKQIKSMEHANGDLRLQLIEAQSKLLLDSEAPFPVPDDVLELGFHGAVDDFKRRLLTQSIVLTKGNRAEAARQLGLQRTYLYRLVKQFQVKA